MTIESLSKGMQSGDVIIDGGNSFWQDDVRRGKALKERGIHYVDVGTSGGVWGVDRGYCMMIGGEKEVVDRLDPIFAALAPGLGDIPRTAGARAAMRGSSRAISTPAPLARGTSSRWSITGSNMA